MAIVQGNPNCVAALTSTPEDGATFCEKPTGHTSDEVGEDFDCCAEHKAMLADGRAAMTAEVNENQKMKETISDLESRLKKLEGKE
jgi:hypothetical protein